MTDETTETTPPEQPEAPSPEQQAIETEARSQGWRPQDEFHGEGWIDASTFVARGREILPILQSHNRRLKDDVVKTKAELAAVQATMKEFAVYHQGVEQRAYQQAMEDLKTQRHAAILEGDGEKVVHLEKQMEVVHHQSQTATGPKVHEPPSQDAATASAEMQEWQAKHQWFGADRIKTGIAVGLAETIQNETDLTGREFLRELDRRLLVEFPGKFGPPQSRMEGPSTGGSVPGKGGKKSFANLPPEAQEACTKFVAEGWVTQEQYLKEFAWD